MKTLLCVVGGIITVLLTLFFSAFLIAALWTQFWYRPACAAFGEGMQVKTEFRFWYGCFVTLPDERILPLSIAESILRQEHLLKYKQVK